MTEEQRSIAVVTPQTNLKEFKADVQAMAKLLQNAMHEGYDYGIIPGTKKKSLFDPGAEKLAKFYGLTPSYEMVKEIEDFDKGFFYYKYRCTLTHFKTGKVAGSAERSCNSFEKKYLYGYMNKRNSTEQLIEKINTYQAMAQKRAFVEAVKTATMASEIFIANVEDEVEAPNAPVTQEENPERVKLIRHFYGVAKQRGFLADAAKKGLKNKFSVESTSNLTNKQIMEAIESLETTYDIVKDNEKPRKIVSQTSPDAKLATPAPVVEGEVIERGLGIEDDLADMAASVGADNDDFIKGLEEDKKKAAAGIEPTGDDTEPTDADLFSGIKCYCGCGRTITKEHIYNNYYYSKECNEKYVKEHYQKDSPSKSKFDEMLSRTKKV